MNAFGCPKEREAPLYQRSPRMTVVYALEFSHSLVERPAKEVHATHGIILLHCGPATMPKAWSNVLKENKETDEVIGISRVGD